MRIMWTFLLCACAVVAGDNSFLPLDEFVKDWTISKQFMLEVAEKMPEVSYGFKPTPAEMNFGTLMAHIAASSVYRFQQMSGIQPPFDARKATNSRMSKQDIVKMLEQSFDYVIAALPKLTPEQLDKMYETDWRGRPQANGRQMARNMFVHVAHHRAQAEVYLRIKGIEPPQYTF